MIRKSGVLLRQQSPPIPLSPPHYPPPLHESSAAALPDSIEMKRRGQREKTNPGYPCWHTATVANRYCLLLPFCFFFSFAIWTPSTRAPHFKLCIFERLKEPGCETGNVKFGGTGQGFAVTGYYARITYGVRCMATAIAQKINTFWEEWDWKGKLVTYFKPTKWFRSWMGVTDRIYWNKLSVGWFDATAQSLMSRE